MSGILGQAQESSLVRSIVKDRYPHIWIPSFLETIAMQGQESWKTPIKREKVTLYSSVSFGCLCILVHMRMTENLYVNRKPEVEEEI